MASIKEAAKRKRNLAKRKREADAAATAARIAAEIAATAADGAAVVDATAFAAAAGDALIHRRRRRCLRPPLPFRRLCQESKISRLVVLPYTKVVRLIGIYELIECN